MLDFSFYLINQKLRLLKQCQSSAARHGKLLETTLNGKVA
jgi:hypothetical protein